jgi:hypothetical protein
MNFLSFTPDIMNFVKYLPHMGMGMLMIFIIISIIIVMTILVNKFFSGSKK